jgi:hypothetical protein
MARALTGGGIREMKSGASVVHPALLDNSINCQQQADVCTGKDAVIQRYDGQINDVQ